MKYILICCLMVLFFSCKDSSKSKDGIVRPSVTFAEQERPPLQNVETDDFWINKNGKISFKMMKPYEINYQKYIELTNLATEEFIKLRLDKKSSGQTYREDEGDYTFTIAGEEATLTKGDDFKEKFVLAHPIEGILSMAGGEMKYRSCNGQKILKVGNTEKIVEDFQDAKALMDKGDEFYFNGLAMILEKEAKIYVENTYQLTVGSHCP